MGRGHRCGHRVSDIVQLHVRGMGVHAAPMVAAGIDSRNRLRDLYVVGVGNGLLLSDRGGNGRRAMDSSLRGVGGLGGDYRQGVGNH